MKLDIIQAGAPVLRQAARNLELHEIRSPSVQELIASMRSTLEDAGVGLAAPQVGIAIRLAVIEDRCRNPLSLPPEAFQEQERTPVPFHVIINPRVTVCDGPQATFFEGCLSIPGFRGAVPRARTIQVECQDENGNFRSIAAQGWYARILQHEIDHLNGVMYIDRMHARTFMANEMFTRYWKDTPVAEVISLLGTSDAASAGH